MECSMQVEDGAVEEQKESGGDALLPAQQSSAGDGCESLQQASSGQFTDMKVMYRRVPP